MDSMFKGPINSSFFPRELFDYIGIDVFVWRPVAGSGLPKIQAVRKKMGGWRMVRKRPGPPHGAAHRLHPGGPCRRISSKCHRAVWGFVPKANGAGCMAREMRPQEACVNQPTKPGWRNQGAKSSESIGNVGAQVEEEVVFHLEKGPFPCSRAYSTPEHQTVIPANGSPGERELARIRCGAGFY